MYCIAMDLVLFVLWYSVQVTSGAVSSHIVPGHTG